MTSEAVLRFDEWRTASLDGVWSFERCDEPGVLREIRVPGLWEAQGFLELDGTNVYRRSFVLDETEGFWSLRFGAVMDIADVELNGVELGSHDAPFTPFVVDATAAVRTGSNELVVRVTDPALDDPDHIRMAHGKQGWANHVFPSRPSLYMTYGGIWQSVSLHRHGPIRIADLFVHPDPDDLCVSVTVENVSDEEVVARVAGRTLGAMCEEPAQVRGRSTAVVGLRYGATNAPTWSPRSPLLHDALVDVSVGARWSDSQQTRYGLRTVRVDGDRILLNGEPYRMKSVLVQGFGADGLYAEGTKEQIVDEVATAKAMGFNTLRLHIKAFDPVYLDVCDELGMLVHSDIPIAEPIAHEELDSGTLVSERCLRAAAEQVVRDRNHPSVILWSAMNELCLDRLEAREWDVYERFARDVYGLVAELDPTRPIIENDWVEPAPERVFCSPILTAHWYGRLHADYLEKIDAKSKMWADVGRPLYVTEFGDWGLPEMPELADPPFWDTREAYAAGLAGTQWPGTMTAFVRETQRYQGLSDRLQAEVFRRHDRIGGYCLTELTDVPHELNGVLDLDRNPKPIAVAEIARMNQTVLPMLELGCLVHQAGKTVRAPLHVANDGPELTNVRAEVRFGDSPWERENAPGDHGIAIDRLDAHRAQRVGEVAIVAPDVPGSHDLVVRLRSDGRTIAENRYPIHVVDRPSAPHTVRVLGRGPTLDALRAVGAEDGVSGPLVVTEHGLTEEVGYVLRRLTHRGRTAIVLAQEPSAGVHYPVPVLLQPIATKWGSSVFHFTTDHDAMTSLPRRNVLVAEDSTIQATSVVVEVDGARFPSTPVVCAYKPSPGAITGTVVGEHRHGSGRVIMCQYRVVDQAVAGDAAALALLADLVRWAARPADVMTRSDLAKPDGRVVSVYGWSGVG